MTRARYLTPATRSAVPAARVYLVGSHSVGKSTLAEWIARHYGLPMVHEVAREVESRQRGGLDALRVDVAAVSAYQRQVFAEQLAREAAHGDGGFVSDRAFDNLAYYADHGDGVAELAESKACRDYVRSVRERGTVFFVRPHPDLAKADGTRARRDVDMAQVWRLDGMVKLLLELWRVPWIPVDPVSMQERQRVVVGVLGVSRALGF